MSFLRKKIFTFFPESFGLDLSDLSLKSVWLEREGKTEILRSFGSIPLPLGAISDGEIVNEDVVVDGIRKLLGQSGPRKIRKKRVICSLPETKAFLRILSLPKMKESEVREAIKWEIEANIPLSLDQVYYDWQILSRNIAGEDGKMSILVVAISRTVADQFVSVLERAGLEVTGLETESVAQARALLDEQESERTTLIVDIGDRRTSFLMAIGNIPCFTSSLPLSSQMITDAISKEMGIPFEEAEELKLKHGVGSFFGKNPFLHAAKPVLDSLATEIERTVDFYLNSLRYSLSVDAIILCGGGSKMKGVLPYLSKRLGRALEFGDPWVNVDLDGRLPLIDRDRSVQYSTAIGLALRGLDEYENIA